VPIDNYPNSAGIWGNAPGAGEPLPIEGEAAHWDHRVDDDHWEQPGNLFRMMTADQREALFENAARAMADAAPHIKERHVTNCDSAWKKCVPIDTLGPRAKTLSIVTRKCRRHFAKYGYGEAGEIPLR
jgi:hypothetical protein